MTIDRETQRSESRTGETLPGETLPGETRRLLTRWLAGELDAEEERRLRHRIEAEPELARAAAAQRRTWEALQPPPGAAGEAGGGVPPGFAGRVMARVRQEAATPRLSWSTSPAWARAAGAAALVAGLLVGAGLGDRIVPPPAAGRGVATAPVQGSGATDRGALGEGATGRGAAGAPTASGTTVAAAPAATSGTATTAAPPATTGPAANAGSPASPPGDAGAYTAPDDLATLYAELYDGSAGGEAADGTAWGGASLAEGYAAALTAAFGEEAGT